MIKIHVPRRPFSEEEIFNGIDPTNDKDKYNYKYIKRTPSNSDPRDLRLLRHLISVMEIKPDQ